MAFDVKKLRSNPDRSEACAPPAADRGGDDLTARLEASVVAVAINRPATLAEYRALPAEDDALEVTTIEGPGAQLVAACPKAWAAIGIAIAPAEPPTLAERHAALVSALETLLTDARELAVEIGGVS